MCRTKRRTQDTHATTDGYVGETMRLDGKAALMMRPHWQRRGFPWWSLWLTWPLIGLIKWAAVPLAQAATSLLDLLRQPITVEISLLPVVLVVLGLALILRRRG